MTKKDGRSLDPEKFHIKLTIPILASIIVSTAICVSSVLAVYYKIDSRITTTESDIVSVRNDDAKAVQQVNLAISQALQIRDIRDSDLKKAVDHNWESILAMQGILGWKKDNDKPTKKKGVRGE